MTRLLLVALLQILVSGACALDVDHAACPCLAGYTCCERTNTCLPPGEVCAPAPVRRWSSMVSGTTEQLKKVWGTSATNIHVVGMHGALFHYDGNVWSPMVSPTTNAMDGLWGVDRTHIIAVGENGTILYYNGSAWAAMDPGVPNTIVDVWGPAFNDLFAVGTGATILHFDGEAWSPMVTQTSTTLRGVWGADSKNVFALAVDGNILRWDGLVWSGTGSGVQTPLLWAWGRGPSDVFAGGERGVVLHYDGRAWKPAGANLPLAAQTYQACGDAREMFIVGELDYAYVGQTGDPSGVVFHHDGAGWSQLDPGTKERLNGIWCHDGDVYVVGNYGKILRYGS